MTYLSKFIKAYILVLLLGSFLSLDLFAASAGIKMTAAVRRQLAGELKKRSPRFLYIADSVLSQNKLLSNATISRDVIDLLLSSDTQCFIEVNASARERTKAGEQVIPKFILVNAELKGYCVFGNDAEDLAAFRRGKLGCLDYRDVLLASNYSTVDFERVGVEYEKVELALSIEEYPDHLRYIRLRQVGKPETSPKKGIASSSPVSRQDLEKNFGKAVSVVDGPKNRSFTVVEGRDVPGPRPSSICAEAGLNRDAKPFRPDKKSILCLDGVLDAASMEFSDSCENIYQETLRMLVFDRNEAFLFDSGVLVLQYNDINIVFDCADPYSRLCPRHSPVVFDRISCITRCSRHEQKVKVNVVVDTVGNSVESQQLGIKLVENPYAIPGRLCGVSSFPECLCQK